MLGGKPASQGNPVTHLRAPASTLRASPPLPTWPSPHGGKGIGGLRDLRVIWPRASYRGRGRWAMQSAGKSYGSDSASGESQSADASSPNPSSANEPPPTLTGMSSTSSESSASEPWRGCGGGRSTSCVRRMLWAGGMGNRAWPLDSSGRYMPNASSQ